MVRSIVPALELDSNQFEGKVLIALEKTGNVRIIPKVLSGRKQELNRFTFALMHTGSSKRKHCRACGGKHRFFVNSFEVNSKEDENVLCDSCGVHLVNLVLFNVPKPEIEKWIISEGSVDPYDLMRDAVQEGIKKGNIKMERVPLKDLDKKSKESVEGGVKWYL